jgi:hypothetical protein
MVCSYVYSYLWGLLDGGNGGEGFGVRGLEKRRARLTFQESWRAERGLV